MGVRPTTYRLGGHWHGRVSWWFPKLRVAEFVAPIALPMAVATAIASIDLLIGPVTARLDAGMPAARVEELAMALRACS